MFKTQNDRFLLFIHIYIAVFIKGYCCNLSGGVALIVWFTMNRICVKKNTIIYVARASSSKRDCDVVALPILMCERLNATTSVRKERLRAWSLLLLAATVRSFAHIPLRISDRNSTLKRLYVVLNVCFVLERFKVACYSTKNNITVIVPVIERFLATTVGLMNKHAPQYVSHRLTTKQWMKLH